MTSADFCPGPLTAWHNLTQPGQVTGDRDQLRVVAGGKSPIAVTGPRTLAAALLPGDVSGAGGERLGRVVRGRRAKRGALATAMGRPG